MSERNAMTTLTRWVLAPQEARRRALGRRSPSPAFAAHEAGRATRCPQQFNVPGREGVRRQQPDRRDLRQRRRRRAARARSSTLPRARPSTRRASRAELEAALAQGRGRAARRARRLLRLHPRPGLRLRRRPHDLRARLHPGQGRGRPRARPRPARRRPPSTGVTVGGARRRSPASTRCAPPPPTAARAAARASPSRPLIAGGGALLVLAFVFALVDGDRAAADGDGRHPDDLPAGLAAGQRHRRLGDRQVPRSPWSAWRSRSTTRCWSWSAGARSASAARDRTRTPSSTPCSTPAGPSSSAARPSPSRCSRWSPCPVPFLRSIGIAGMLIPLVSVAVAVTLLPVVLATIGPRLDRPPRAPRRTAPAAAGRPGRASSSATAGPRPIPSTAVLARARRRRLHDPARQPAGRLAGPVGPGRAGLEQLEDSGIGTGPLSPFDSLVRSGDPAAVAPRARRRRRRPQRRRARGLAARRHRRSSRSSRPRTATRPAGRATLDRVRAATGLPADVVDRRRGRAERRLPRRGLRQLPARHRADRRA